MKMSRDHVITNRNDYWQIPSGIKFGTSFGKNNNK